MGTFDWEEMKKRHQDQPRQWQDVIHTPVAAWSASDQAKWLELSGRLVEFLKGEFMAEVVITVPGKPDEMSDEEAFHEIWAQADFPSNLFDALSVLTRINLAVEDGDQWR